MPEAQANEGRPTRVVDAVCNLLTPDIVASRPSWSRTFHGEKIGTNRGALDGVSLEQHIELMDEAGIDIAFLIAPRMGRRGLPTSWELDPKVVIDAVERYPDRFRALAGVNPYDGVRGIKELDRLVTEYGFVGAHFYPHWFEMAPDHARWYPFYAKCGELDVPIQMQVGRCLRYAAENPLPSVGRPATLDTVACHFPDVRLVGIHIGWPWTEEMISVADKHPNVYIGSDAYAPKHWPEAFVRFADSWGRGKVLFGTDWPVIPFDRAIREIDELGLRPAARAALLGEAALDVYRVT
ncbi:MAG: amidohydrolase family protein [Propionibacteriales bacterium]|nr:amidohydrolase family protein [Propionibacteriales bacterium]